MRKDQIIEWSTDHGLTWHHGKTIDARFANDKAVIREQCGYVRAQVRDDNPGLVPVENWAQDVMTRVLDEDDMRAEVNRPPSAGKFYAVRQAKTKVIGSRLMSREEADREVACWIENIGPAKAVPDSPAMRKAVRAHDQDVHTGLPRELYGNPGLADGRRELCQVRKATLNGAPAVISGARNEFATVATLSGCQHCEFAWETVARIVAHGAEFRS